VVYCHMLSIFFYQILHLNQAITSFSPHNVSTLAGFCEFSVYQM
jgi:hypothetical protein